MVRPISIITNDSDKCWNQNEACLRCKKIIMISEKNVATDKNYILRKNAPEVSKC